MNLLQEFVNQDGHMNTKSLIYKRKHLMLHAS